MRRLSALAALVAMVVGVLSPAGFMLAATPRGPTIVVCTGHGPLNLTEPGKAPPVKSGET